jgi:hypothetical protein
MKATLLTLLTAALFAAFALPPTPLDGAWQTTQNGQTVMLTIMDNYLMQTTYEPTRYVSTRGGACMLAGNQLRLTVEFDTQDSTRVGQTETYAVTTSSGSLRLNERTYTRVSEPGTLALAGLWRITGRANETGQVTTMQRGPRKTLKLLTNGRFQWAAINPQTKQFFGTGGGTYTLINGQYTETIDFFSRDNSRVGKSLTFNAELAGGDWKHTGKSSTGAPVSEVWSREK